MTTKIDLDEKGITHSAQHTCVARDFQKYPIRATDWPLQGKNTSYKNLAWFNRQTNYID